MTSHASGDEVNAAGRTRHFDDAYDGTPPWDIGRPQPAFVRLVEDGALREGPVLDLGCGTGENALFLAAKGFDVLGIDGSAKAIAKAIRRADERKLEATFLVHDTLDLVALKRTFPTAIDSGLFHVFGNRERVRFRDQLRRVLRPGGTYFMLCFSEKEPADWGGPRRVTREEIREAFPPPAFRVRSIRAARFASNFHDGGGRAYLATIERPSGGT